MASVTTRIVPITKLSDETIVEMYKLFEQYYVDISEEQFRSDLFEKTHVFLCYEKTEIVGFSTIFRKRIPAVGHGRFLFSGDTVLKEKYWGSKLLQKTFFRYIVQSKLLSPFEPVYWMLISKGFKTYLMMRKNFKQSYPQPGGKMPENYKVIMDRFYHWKFGDAYSPKTGLVIFESSHGAVKGKIATPSANQKEDTEVKYFLERNPKYEAGVELACLTEICYSDFFMHIPKYFLKFKKRKSHATRSRT